MLFKWLSSISSTVNAKSCCFFLCFVLSGYKLEKLSILKKKMLALSTGVCIIEFVNRRKEFLNEQRRISTRNFKKI